MNENEPTSDGLWLDWGLLVSPWLLFAWMIVWRLYLGPIANPPWQVGNEALYGAGVLFQGWGIGIGVPIVAGIRYWIYRRRVALCIATMMTGFFISSFCSSHVTDARMRVQLSVNTIGFI